MFPLRDGQMRGFGNVVSRSLEYFQNLEGSEKRVRLVRKKLRSQWLNWTAYIMSILFWFIKIFMEGGTPRGNLGVLEILFGTNLMVELSNVSLKIMAAPLMEYKENVASLIKDLKK